MRQQVDRHEAQRGRHAHQRGELDRERRAGQQQAEREEHRDQSGDARRVREPVELRAVGLARDMIDHVAHEQHRQGGVCE